MYNYIMESLIAGAKKPQADSAFVTPKLPELDKELKNEKSHPRERSVQDHMEAYPTLYQRRLNDIIKRKKMNCAPLKKIADSEEEESEEESDSEEDSDDGEILLSITGLRKLKQLNGGKPFFIVVV